MNRGDLIEAIWTGEAFEPRGNWSMAQCHERLGAGQVVYLDIDPARSAKSHNHQFAFVKDALENLPEGLIGLPYAANADTLRKHALIETGFCDTSMIAVGTHRRALRVASFMGQLAHDAHGYAITAVEGPVVYCHTPQSQREKAMGKERFQESKKAIGEWLEDLIGAERGSLTDVVRK